VLPAGVSGVDAARRMLFNDRLDAAIAGFFVAAVVVILVDSMREWYLVLGGRKAGRTTEVPFPGGAIAAD